MASIESTPPCTRSARDRSAPRTCHDIRDQLFQDSMLDRNIHSVAAEATPELRALLIRRQLLTEGLAQDHRRCSDSLPQLPAASGSGGSASLPQPASNSQMSSAQVTPSTRHRCLSPSQVQPTPRTTAVSPPPAQGAHNLRRSLPESRVRRTLVGLQSSEVFPKDRGTQPTLLAKVASEWATGMVAREVAGEARLTRREPQPAAQPAPEVHPEVRGKRPWAPSTNVRRAPMTSAALQHHQQHQQHHHQHHGQTAVPPTAAVATTMGPVIRQRPEYCSGASCTSQAAQSDSQAGGCCEAKPGPVRMRTASDASSAMPTCRGSGTDTYLLSEVARLHREAEELQSQLEEARHQNEQWAEKHRQECLAKEEAVAGRQTTESRNAELQATLVRQEAGLAKLEAMEVELEALRVKNEELAKDVEQLRQERGLLARQEREAIGVHKEEVGALNEKVARLEKGSQALVQDNLRLSEELQQAKDAGGGGGPQEDVNALKLEETLKENERLSDENDRFIGENARYRCDNDHFRGENDRVRLENDRLKAEIVKLTEMITQRPATAPVAASVAAAPVPSSLPSGTLSRSNSNGVSELAAQALHPFSRLGTPISTSCSPRDTIASTAGAAGGGGAESGVNGAAAVPPIVIDRDGTLPPFKPYPRVCSPTASSRPLDSATASPDAAASSSDVTGLAPQEQLRAVLTNPSATASQLRQAIEAQEALLQEARREVAGKEFREKRAALERLNVALDSVDETAISVAVAEARRVGLDAYDIEPAEAKLAELRALSDEQKAAKVAKERRQQLKERAYLLAKRDDADALQDFLQEFGESTQWWEWKDYAGRTLWHVAVELRATHVQELLAPLLGRTGSASSNSDFRRDTQATVTASPNAKRQPLDPTPAQPLIPKLPAKAPNCLSPLPQSALQTKVQATPRSDARSPASIYGSSPSVTPVAANLSPRRAHQAELKVRAFRAVVQDDTAALETVLNGLPVDVWSAWQNKAGKDLLTLSQERGSSAAYALLGKTLGLIEDMKIETYSEREAVWVFLPGEVQPRRASVLEDTTKEATDVLIEFWDGDNGPERVEHCMVRKVWH